ncbi:hypothetical protein [Lentzea sp. NBRC 102530]|uniref:hypothetical protein n=1 Tax=Lentzea sp. NBRC 102530 TaxID=3032201 RepID=UPI0024A051EA|nr:hypothetical protein [Lentzea sp. NBRC 102530]GLY48513.1 hypothetical protein Lesp01_21690 [Lentzea sp. NBRC 102530]
MSEQEIREGMLLAVWDEPPLDFDPDTLIRRVEQKKSRRRALVAVGVATAMIAVVSLSLPGLLPREDNAQLATESPSSASAAPTESPERRAQRLGDGLVAGLRARMPSTKDSYASFGPGRSGMSLPYETKPPRWKEGDTEFSGFVYFSDEIGPTALRVSVRKESFSSELFCSGADTCQQLWKNNGSFVYGAEFRYNDPQVQQVGVLRSFDSGLVVEITAYAHNPSNGNGQRQTVPVGVAVLTQLVTDPGVVWETG